MSEPIILFNIPESVLLSVIDKARLLYKTKKSRLEYCAMRLGKSRITDPDVFYYYYFERGINENVSK